MPYAQINYQQKLGKGPFSIAAAGCFLTAFSNLLERFGEPIDPPTLNNFFITDNKYTHDPSEAAGTADNLYWGAVSAYDGHIIPVGTGVGWPDSNDAIVEFRYKGPTTGQMVTHFTLVQDAAAHTIIDSYDGRVKVSPYGTPVAYAKYERHAPVVVTPPPPPAQLSFTVEPIREVTKQLKVNSHLWDMNQRSWPGMVNNPVSAVNAGTEFKSVAIAHHLLGGEYYLPEGGNGSQGYNVVDCQDPVATPPPEPTPAPAPPEPTPPPAPKTYSENTVDGIKFDALPNSPIQYFVINPKGAEKWSFKDVVNWRGFKSVQHLDYGTELFISGVAHHPIPPNGADYYMTGDDWGNFKTKGQPDNFCGFNWSDISTKRPPAQAPVAPTPPPAAETAPAKPAEAVAAPTTAVHEAAASTDPLPWQEHYVPFPKPVRYVATRNVVVNDLAGQQPSMPLPKYDPTVSDKVGIVQVYGTINKDGIDYYRVKTNNDPNFSFWYCIPKVDADTKTPLLLVLPTNPLAPVSKISVARDTLQLTKARLENDMPKFLDDIMPKWFKNKK